VFQAPDGLETKYILTHHECMHVAAARFWKPWAIQKPATFKLITCAYTLAVLQALDALETKFVVGPLATIEASAHASAQGDFVAGVTRVQLAAFLDELQRARRSISAAYSAECLQQRCHADTQELPNTKKRCLSTDFAKSAEC
jgi:hypothetical protein